jgi:hypothetical protein
MAIEAAWWREERAQQRTAWQAWTTAALIRAKRLPSLESVLRPRRELSPAELAERKAHHRQLTEMVNRPEMQSKLVQFVEQKRVGRKARNRQRPDPGRSERARQGSGQGQ